MFVMFVYDVCVFVCVCVCVCVCMCMCVYVCICVCYIQAYFTESNIILKPLGDIKGRKGYHLLCVHVHPDGAKEPIVVELGGIYKFSDCEDPVFITSIVYYNNSVKYV
jgi:hypothetical protein